jgi:hypothetical protein
MKEPSPCLMNLRSAALAPRFGRVTKRTTNQGWEMWGGGSELG